MSPVTFTTIENMQSNNLNKTLKGPQRSQLILWIAKNKTRCQQANWYSEVQGWAKAEIGIDASLCTVKTELNHQGIRLRSAPVQTPVSLAYRVQQLESELAHLRTALEVKGLYP
jgi:hypothetical protein